MMHKGAECIPWSRSSIACWSCLASQQPWTSVRRQRSSETPPPVTRGQHTRLWRASAVLLTSLSLPFCCVVRVAWGIRLTGDIGAHGWLPLLHSGLLNIRYFNSLKLRRRWGHKKLCLQCLIWKKYLGDMSHIIFYQLQSKHESVNIRSMCVLIRLNTVHSVLLEYGQHPRVSMCADTVPVLLRSVCLVYHTCSTPGLYHNMYHMYPPFNVIHVYSNSSWKHQRFIWYSVCKAKVVVCFDQNWILLVPSF